MQAGVMIAGTISSPKITLNAPLLEAAVTDAVARLYASQEHRPSLQAVQDVIKGAFREALAIRIYDAAHSTGQPDPTLKADVEAFAAANPALDGTHGSIPRLSKRNPLDCLVVDAALDRGKASV